MCSQTRNSCAKPFDNRSRSKTLKPKKIEGGGSIWPPPPSLKASRVKNGKLRLLGKCRLALFLYGHQTWYSNNNTEMDKFPRRSVGIPFLVIINRTTCSSKLFLEHKLNIRYFLVSSIIVKRTKHDNDYITLIYGKLAVVRSAMLVFWVH